jgi:hypothetical protein
MCGLCGSLNEDSHWATDITDRDAIDRVKKLNKLKRTKIMNNLFWSYGVSVRSSSGSFYVVSNKKGGSKVAYNLDSILEACELLAGKSIDPLNMSQMAK